MKGTRFGIFVFGECPRWRHRIVADLLSGRAPHSCGNNARAIQGFVSIGHWAIGLRPPSPRRGTACSSRRSRKGQIRPEAPCVFRSSHFSMCAGRHSSNACSRSERKSRANTNALLALQESLLHRMVKHPEQRGVKAHHIRDSAGLRMRSSGFQVSGSMQKRVPVAGDLSFRS